MIHSRIIKNTFILCLLLASIFLSSFAQTRLKKRQKFNQSDFIYNLGGSSPNNGSGGGSVRSLTVDQMASLEGEGLTYFLFSLKPCGVVLPHVHPRSSELIFAINARNLTVGFIEENGGRTILNSISSGDVTIIPEGLVHFATNFGCEDVSFISALNSEDPGVSAITNVFNFPSLAIAGAFNQSEETIRLIKAGLPSSPASGIEDCLKLCGLCKK
jgi:oxalate decarboxylase/phosphoglucose isomerase-like protein (cupin superfamily)